MYHFVQLLRVLAQHFKALFFDLHKRENIVLNVLEILWRGTFKPKQKENRVQVS